MDGGGAGEGVKDPKAPPVLLDREVESAAEARTLIDDVQLQLSRLGRWVDLVRAREERASDSGIFVPRLTGPETQVDLPVPATPNGAQILRPHRVIGKIIKSQNGNRVVPIYEERKHVLRPDDFDSAKGEIKSGLKRSVTWLRPEGEEEHDPRYGSHDEVSPEYFDPTYVRECSSDREFPDDSN